MLNIKNHGKTQTSDIQVTAEYCECFMFEVYIDRFCFLQPITFALIQIGGQKYIHICFCFIGLVRCRISTVEQDFYSHIVVVLLETVLNEGCSDFLA